VSALSLLVEEFTELPEIGMSGLVSLFNTFIC
jgi:hypothetical protein